MRNSIIFRIDKYTKEGSGWTLCRIVSFNLSLYRFNISRGSYGKVELPVALLSKHCIINLNCDNCFKWAVLSALHYKDVEHTERVTSYTQFKNEYEFPDSQIVTANQVAEFVKKSKLAIFTHSYDEKKHYAECISSAKTSYWFQSRCSSTALQGPLDGNYKAGLFLPSTKFRYF